MWRILMARFRISFLFVFIVTATATFGQTSSSLTGRITLDGNPLPGVTVTITSPNLQGTRAIASDVNGNYNFAALPAGTYTVRFEMESVQTVSKTAQIGPGQTGRVDGEMHLTAVAEAITVAANAPAGFFAGSEPLPRPEDAPASPSPLPSCVRGLPAARGGETPEL
jgi:hypothetical protein